MEGESGTNGITGIDMEDTGGRKWNVGVQGTNKKGSFAIIDETAGNKRRLYITKSGKVIVPGKIKANQYQGDGSLLTNIPPGPQGKIGAKGDTGATGEQGPQGKKVILEVAATCGLREVVQIFTTKMGMLASGRRGRRCR